MCECCIIVVVLTISILHVSVYLSKYWLKTTTYEYASVSLIILYIYKSHWELCKMHIPKTCFPLRLMHDGSQGQHLVNRFKLHKDSSAVQWMQNQIGILHWAHTVKATEGQVIPSLHRCTFVRPPHESRHLPHYSVYSFLRPERKLTNLLFLILWIDPKMGQLTKLGGDLVCFQCLESGISCVKRLRGWHSSTAVTAMPTHTHIHVRIIIWLYIYVLHLSSQRSSALQPEVANPHLTDVLSHSYHYIHLHQCSGAVAPQQLHALRWLLMVAARNDEAIRVFNEEGKKQHENLAGIWAWHRGPNHSV